MQAEREDSFNESGITSTPSAGSSCHARGRRRASARSGPDLLLEAAQEVFLRRGFAGALIREIAHRADLSPTMIYYHFGGKEGLACALVERAYLCFREDLAEVVDSDGGGHPHLKLRGVVDLFRHHLGTRAILGRLLRDPSIVRFEALHRSIQLVQEEIRTWSRDYLAEGQRAGLIRPDINLDVLGRWSCADMGTFPVAASFAANPLTEALLISEDSCFATPQ